MKKLTRCCTAFLLGMLLVTNVASVNAQEDFDQMFEKMMREFFPQDFLDEIDSIRAKDRKPENGKSFYRDDPRFLELKTRQIKQREKDEEEKQHVQNLAAFRPLAQALSPSVIALFAAEDAERRIAYATAVDQAGLMVTKASEVQGLRDIHCVDAKGEKFTARIVKLDETHDLALLKAERRLTPIEFESSSLDEGTLLVTVENSANPVAMGTLAVKPRSIIGTNRGFLGVEPGPGNDGVFIKGVTRGSAADRAGVQAGDIVQSINEKPTRSVAELVREIGSRQKGESIRLRIDRNGQLLSITAVLDGRMMRGERAARFEMMRRLGTVLSRRHDEFPSVIEHDSPILPNECGGPLVDLDGKVVGINIARAGRTNSYALPMNIVKQFIESYRG